ncbi:MAG TPA: hypothetical protein VJW20_03665 [Candidatus Angelobacter sp.]|nr:hypothetical protein [Candidatus Angelobacter sp.]
MLLLRSLFLLLGCDPAINIYQVKLVHPPIPMNAKQPELSVSVKRYHSLIGEDWYEPEVTIKNSSSSAVTVTGMELITTTKTNTRKASQEGIYPLTLRPEAATVLHARFDLDQGLLNTFSKPAELLVHYRIGNQNEIVKTRLVSGAEKNWIF